MIDFDFRLFFPRVFKEKGGFDIVIGNPPYVRHEKIRQIKPFLQKQNYEVFTSTADLYVYFYEKGYQLLREQGILSYITSNKWMRTLYGERLRKFLKGKTTILEIIDFRGYKIFDQTVDTSILFFRKEVAQKDNTLKFLIVSSDVKDLESYLKKKEYMNNWDIMCQDRLYDNVWSLCDENVLLLRDKIEKVGKPLKDWDIKIYSGIKTGCNEAFIIDTDTRDRILSKCKDEDERKRTEVIIKPLLKGRDIKKYKYKWSGLWIILAKTGFHKVAHLYPAVVEHLSKYEDRLKKRDKNLLELNNSPSEEYLKQCEKGKIVLQDISSGSNFAYNDEDMVIDTTGVLITGEDLKYLLGVLNSKPVSFFFKTFYTGACLGDDTIRYKKVFLEKLPVPPIVEENKYISDQIIQKVDKIINITKSEDNEEKNKLESEIDVLVYKLYELNDKEINIINGNSKTSNKGEWKLMYQHRLYDNAWALEDESVLNLKEKIERIGKPLKDWDIKIYSGIKTGCNEAFIIDTETKNRILANCKDEEERKRTEEIIKPVLRGRDIEKYRYKWAGLWIIGTFPAKNLNINDYPALKEYLASFGDRLLQDGKSGHRKKTSNKWFETQDNIAYYPEFEKEKIVYGQFRKGEFAYDKEKIYLSSNEYMITGKNLKYILGVLNSSLAYHYQIMVSNSLSNQTTIAQKTIFTTLPLPPITKENHPIADQIIQKVDQILTITKSEEQEKQKKVKEIQKEIDLLVYQLYELDNEEIKIIENG